VRYNGDSEGTSLNYRVVGKAISSVRADAPLSASWSAEIAEDFEKRGR
jgi:hypothetical protein